MNMNTAMDLSMKKNTRPDRDDCPPYDYVDLTTDNWNKIPSNEGNEQEIIELRDESEENPNDDDEEWEEEQEVLNNQWDHHQNNPFQSFPTYNVMNTPYGIHQNFADMGKAFCKSFGDWEKTKNQTYPADCDEGENFMSGSTDQPEEAEEDPNQPNLFTRFAFQYRDYGLPRDQVNEGPPRHSPQFNSHIPQGNQHGFWQNPFYRPEGNPFTAFSNQQFMTTRTGGGVTFSYCKINVNDPGPEWGPWGPRPFPFGNNF